MRQEVRREISKFMKNKLLPLLLVKNQCILAVKSRFSSIALSVLPRGGIPNRSYETVQTLTTKAEISWSKNIRNSPSVGIKYVSFASLFKDVLVMQNQHKGIELDTLHVI